MRSANRHDSLGQEFGLSSMRAVRSIFFFGPGEKKETGQSLEMMPTHPTHVTTSLLNAHTLDHLWEPLVSYLCFTNLSRMPGCLSSSRWWQLKYVNVLFHPDPCKNDEIWWLHIFFKSVGSTTNHSFLVELHPPTNNWCKKTQVLSTPDHFISKVFGGDVHKYIYIYTGIPGISHLNQDISQVSWASIAEVRDQGAQKFSVFLWGGGWSVEAQM